MKKTNSKWTVYKHISPSGKVYVGITSYPPEKRWGINGYRYLGKTKKGEFAHPYFAHAILKYGWDNFQHIIIEKDLSEEDAKNLEILLISHYKKLNKSYNITMGGNGRLGVRFKHSKETVEKIKLHHRRCQTEATKTKIHNNQIGVKFPEWRKKLLSEAHSHERKKVCQYSLDGVLINIFNSIMDAARQTGTHSGNISSACKGRQLTANGFKWKYYETNN